MLAAATVILKLFDDNLPLVLHKSSLHFTIIIYQAFYAIPVYILYV